MNTEIPKSGAVPPDGGNTSRKKSLRFWIIVSIGLLFFLMGGVVQAIYTYRLEVPPFEEMEYSVGTVSFIQGGRHGSRLKIKTKDNSSFEFSCKNSSVSSQRCIDQKYAGRMAEIWWYWATVYPGEVNRRPAQIIVDGKVILSIETTTQRLKDVKRFAPVDLAWCFLIFVVVVFIAFTTERNSHASKRS